LLLSERSGEYYEQIAHGTETTEQLHEIVRADHILLFVDGKKMIDPGGRHGVKNDLVTLLRTLLHDNILKQSHHIGVVLTKYDCVVDSPQKTQAEEYFQNIIATVRNICGQHVATIEEFTIAARPEDGELEQRFGVDKLLEKCMSNITEAPYSPKPLPTSNRIYLHFGSVAGVSP
jgi:hypothetical protein